MYSQNNKIILLVSCKPQNIYSAVKSLNINTHRERGMPLHTAH